MRSCSAALRQAADHALIRGTKRAQQVQRIMLKLMLPARAARWPIPDRTLPSGNLPRTPQPARTITGPGPNAFELLKRRCRSTWSRRRLRGSCDAAERPTDLSFRSRPASSGRLPVSRRGGEAQLEAAAARRRSLTSSAAAALQTRPASTIVSTALDEHRPVLMTRKKSHDRQSRPSLSYSLGNLATMWEMQRMELYGVN